MSESSIQLFSENIEYNYPTSDKLNTWISKVLVSEGQSTSSINIIFCSDDFLLKINQEYLSHDYFTDIITFQYNLSPIEGELYISIDRVKENAENLKVAFREELHRVIIHGVLHLMGYDDKSDEEIAIMRSKENEYLAVWNDK